MTLNLVTRCTLGLVLAFLLLMLPVTRLSAAATLQG